MIKGRKKGKGKEQETVPLHDILNPEQGEGDGDGSQSTSSKAKKKTKKNEISPEIASSSLATIESQSTTKQDAWTSGENIPPGETPSQIKPGEKKGILNPALQLNDEPLLPGSVTDLQDPSMDAVATEAPVTSKTVIDGAVATQVPNTGQNNHSNLGSPDTPNISSTPEAQKTAVHRTLFAKFKNKTKVQAMDDKENTGRPSTAPGYRVPFPDEFTGSTPQLKRPASASASDARKPKSGRMDMTASMPALRENSFNVSARSLKGPPEATRKAVAYVPYLHARNTLARVIEDMKSMKMNHLSIVTQIEEQYKGIEIDSREQFNAYVLSLQDEQRNKIDAFKKVIEEHNAEVKERNKYWNETLQSLSKRNKELLQQKRSLFLARKEDALKFDKERDELQGGLADRDSKIRQLENLLEGHEDERPRIAKAVPVAAAAAVVVSDLDEKPDANLLAVTSTSEEAGKWKERYEQEREERLEQGRKLEKEMQQVKALLASKGASSMQERESYEEKIKELMKEYAKVKLEYETISTFLQSLMASMDSDEQFLAAKNKIEEDRAIMHEEQTRLQADITVWQDDWKKSHDGNLPGENEKPDAAKELDTQLAEVEQMLSDLDKREEALIMLKEGRTPQIKGGVPEPIVTTVEVRDPNLVRDLETAKFEIYNLEEKLRGAEGDAIRISDLENENADLRNRLIDYEKQLQASDRSPAVVASVALGATAARDDDELEDAKRKIEELKQRLEDTKIGVVPLAMDEEDEDITDLMKKLEDRQNQIEKLEKDLLSEKEKTSELLADNKILQSDLERVKEDLSTNEKEIDLRVVAATAMLTASIKDKEKEILDCNAKIEELENARLANLDVDAKMEIDKAKKEAKLAKINADKIKKDKDEMDILLMTKDQKVKSLEEKSESQKTVEANLRNDLNTARKEKHKAVKECEAKFTEREKKRKAEEDEKIKIFENKIRKLEAAAVGGAAVKAGRKSAVGDPNADRKIQRLEAQLLQMKQQKQDDQNRIKGLEQELKELKAAGKGGAVDKDKKLVDKKMKDLEKKLDLETRKFERELKRANDLAEELDQLKKEHGNLQKEHAALSAECEELKAAAATGAALAGKVAGLESENKQLTAEVKTLTDNYNTERVLRKKYYNMVEDMKGKIRVYCRYRPMSKTETGNKNKPVVKAPDEYTVQVETRGNMKEFQFDQVFTSESTQEQVFEDTYNLVQSAVDGYNVCIFAYGQTGSGKTYTMIGDSGQTQPGIAPRAFNRIFDLIEENKGKLKFEVSCYMLELYNDNLVDLLAPKGSKDTKLDVKKDKKGMVYVQGSVIQRAGSSQELYKIFEKGSESRHVASTKMNAESSRSHLVVAILLESQNLTTGAVTRGKLSLVDLAGSERVGKTGATAQQLKEANSINKSLSALGDVISALSSEQSFIPYRNNKLTMLMQDSLGGNAKTLMFVNISPADYNADETAISLTYASRVKLITNDASKNAESKEVARLRSLVAKLKAGESVEEED